MSNVIQLFPNQEEKCPNCKGEGFAGCVAYLRSEGYDIKINQCCECYLKLNNNDDEDPDIA